jgi:hypothetical protein
MIYTTVTGAYQVSVAFGSCAVLLVGLLIICSIILLDMRRRKEPL